MKTQELDQLFGKRTPEAQIAADADALMFRFLSIVDQRMEECGMTKRELAAKIGTSPAFVSQLFRGHKLINLETLAKMQAALGIEFEVVVHPNRGQGYKSRPYGDEVEGGGFRIAAEC